MGTEHEPPQYGMMEASSLSSEQLEDGEVNYRNILDQEGVQATLLYCHTTTGRPHNFVTLSGILLQYPTSLLGEVPIITSESCSTGKKTNWGNLTIQSHSDYCYENL